MSLQFSASTAILPANNLGKAIPGSWLFFALKLVPAAIDIEVINEVTRGEVLFREC